MRLAVVNLEFLLRQDASIPEMNRWDEPPAKTRQIADPLNQGAAPAAETLRSLVRQAHQFVVLTVCPRRVHGLGGKY